MVALIKKANENKEIPKSRLYLALGKSLIISPPPKSQQMLILNDVWKVVSKIEDVDEYCEIAVVFIQYLLQFFTVQLLVFSTCCGLFESEIGNLGARSQHILEGCH